MDFCNLPHKCAAAVSVPMMMLSEKSGHTAGFVPFEWQKGKEPSQDPLPLLFVHSNRAEKSQWFGDS